MLQLLKFTLFGAVSMTSIVWFLLIKGLKESTIMTKDVHAWIDAHTWIVLSITFLITYLISLSIYLFAPSSQQLKLSNPPHNGGGVAQRRRGSAALFKVIVLMGTFALATAFAGNDLVNFIGVPLAGFSSFTDWQAAGAASPAESSSKLPDGGEYLKTGNLSTVGIAVDRFPVLMSVLGFIWQNSQLLGWG